MGTAEFGNIPTVSVVVAQDLAEPSPLQRVLQRLDKEIRCRWAQSNRRGTPKWPGSFWTARLRSERQSQQAGAEDSGQHHEKNCHPEDIPADHPACQPHTRDD